MKKLVLFSAVMLSVFQSTVQAKSSSWPVRSQQETTLMSHIIKALKLPTTARSADLATVTYEQQVEYFHVMLDLIMDPKCKIQHSLMAETFKCYCTEIKKRHSELYQHFCKTPSGFWNVVSHMKTYDKMSDSKLPRASVEKRKRDHKAFDKKYSSYWSQYKVMKKVAKKFK